MSGTERIGTTPERAMAGLMARVERTRHALEQRIAYGTADMRLLWLLADGESRTIRAICEALRLEQSTVHRQVANAEKQGLVTRRKDASSTAWKVSATVMGKTAFENALTTTMAITGAGLARLDDAEQAELIALLGKFLDGYTEAATGTDGD